MLKIKEYTPETGIPKEKKDEVVEFLFKHLDQFGDEKEYIRKCADYAMKDIESPGGYIIMGYADEKLVGAVIVNHTGMGGYIPENILVYIAIHRDFRGKGLGRQLMNKAHQMADGDMKLHVEHDNPARFLYEKLGYKNKYMEMRWKNE